MKKGDEKLILINVLQTINNQLEILSEQDHRIKKAELAVAELGTLSSISGLNFETEVAEIKKSLETLDMAGLVGTLKNITNLLEAQYKRIQSLEKVISKLKKSLTP